LPRRGNFLALVGNRNSKSLLKTVTASLAGPLVRCCALTVPENLPGGRSSDHWSFWKNGFPAVMATDTAPLRYRHYHKTSDTPDKLDFHWLSRVVAALENAVGETCADGLHNGPKSA